MEKLPKLIDNKRKCLGEVLKTIIPEHKTLSIATGYWDLAGTAELINLLENYTSIRLLIGQEPLSSRYQKELKLDFNKPDALFPDKDFTSDLVDYGKEFSEHDKLRETTKKLCNLINSNVLEVKVYRKTTLHAKTFIFGDFASNNAVAILGSSNFTKAGLFTNTELNTTESDYRIVVFEPRAEDQENGYISWFNELWNDEECTPWTGSFKKIIQSSPVGNLTYGPYDAYIKTLMEIYPEELVPPEQLSTNTEDVLYAFQKRNARILINKLRNEKVAILADSVGLGKTITAGAVMKYFLDKDKNCNILVIAPASLKQQWKDDLAGLLGVDELNGDYRIVTQQDTNAIQKLYNEYKKAWRVQKHIDLFVIDEAHNLRSSSGQRYEAIISLLSQHPDAPVLLLTATPINNSLMDLANIIQLASRGKLKSVSVSCPRTDGSSEVIDFFDALKKIQKAIKKAENEHKNIDELLERYKPTIHDGLRHYLVRSTRQGVEAEGGIMDRNTGARRTFPKSIVMPLEYKYEDKITDSLFSSVGNARSEVFENIDPRELNLEALSDLTQRTCHPLDILKQVQKSSGSWAQYVCSEGLAIFQDIPEKNLTVNILQLIYIMSFTPYRPDTYLHKYWGKTPEQLRELKTETEDLIQFSVHNMLQVTWLKRLESSAAALLGSVENYERRLILFEKYLYKGYIVSLADSVSLETYYNDGEDIERAFADYEKYLADKERIISEGGNPSVLEEIGIKEVKADPVVYNLDKIKEDIKREKAIIKVLKDNLAEVAKPENDPKLHALHDQIKEILASGKYGKKVLVFSFFADTINYLAKNVAGLFVDIDPDFVNHAGFISGQFKAESIVGRFSPISKKYDFQPGETEINFLFSTDVLSEGQNLQDAGYLVNYDLHWNPVRMIQRNGRINRIGSAYEAVLVSNMKPLGELDLYLKLVNKLERKIKTIRNTIGLDQGVLNTEDVNPIEFIEKYYKDGILEEEDDSILAHTDKHVIELRKFLGVNPVNSDGFNRVKNIPLGKWNYLSNNTEFRNLSISLVKVKGVRTTVNGMEKEDEGNFFIEVSMSDGGLYKGNFLDSIKALDLIQTVPEDNKKEEDNINLDRKKIAKRVEDESKRQYENAGEDYVLTQQYINALEKLGPYLTSISFADDIEGVLRKGVKTKLIQKKLERILKDVNKEVRSNGAVYPATIRAFEDVFREIQSSIEDEKKIKETIGILNYARK